MDEDLYGWNDEDEKSNSERQLRSREEDLVADEDDAGLGLRPTEPPTLSSSYGAGYSPEYGGQVGSSQSATSYYSSSSSSTSSTEATQSTQTMVNTM